MRQLYIAYVHTLKVAAKDGARPFKMPNVSTSKPWGWGRDDGVRYLAASWRGEAPADFATSFEECGFTPGRVKLQGGGPPAVGTVDPDIAPAVDVKSLWAPLLEAAVERVVARAV